MLPFGFNFPQYVHPKPYCETFIVVLKPIAASLYFQERSKGGDARDDAFRVSCLFPLFFSGPSESDCI